MIDDKVFELIFKEEVQFLFTRTAQLKVLLRFEPITKRKS